MDLYFYENSKSTFRKNDSVGFQIHLWRYGSKSSEHFTNYFPISLKDLWETFILDELPAPILEEEIFKKVLFTVHLRLAASDWPISGQSLARNPLTHFVPVLPFIWMFFNIATITAEESKT